MIDLTGKQRSQLLISILEDNSSEVLKHLSEESSNELSSSLEDIPTLLDEEMKEFLNEVLSKIDEFQSNSNVDMLGESHLDLDSSDIMDSNLDDFDTEVEDTNDDLFDENKSETKFPENYNSPEVVADKLKLQEDQLIAFFFHYFDDELASEIKEHFDVERIEEIFKIEVEINPMSKKIYDKLFNIIVLKTDEESQSDIKEASDETEVLLNENEDADDVELSDDENF